MRQRTESPQRQITRAEAGHEIFDHELAEHGFQRDGLRRKRSRLQAEHEAREESSQVADPADVPMNFEWTFNAVLYSIRSQKAGTPKDPMLRSMDLLGTNDHDICIDSKTDAVRRSFTALKKEAKRQRNCHRHGVTRSGPNKLLKTNHSSSSQRASERSEQVQSNEDFRNAELGRRLLLPHGADEQKMQHIFTTTARAFHHHHHDHTSPAMAYSPLTPQRSTVTNPHTLATVPVYSPHAHPCRSPVPPRPHYSDGLFSFTTSSDAATDPNSGLQRRSPSLQNQVHSTFNRQ